MIESNGIIYEILNEVKEGFQQEAFDERYSEILKKYDYVVGDWGYDQLRLKGFYEDGHPKATFDMKISTLEDYLYEYCNFGCAYFVLRKVSEVPQKDSTGEEDKEEEQIEEQVEEKEKE